MAEEEDPAHLDLTVSHQDPSCDQWVSSLDPAHREKVTLQDWTKTFHSTFRNGHDRIKLDLAPNLVRGPSLLAVAGNARDDGPQNWHLNFRLHNETTTPRTLAVALCQGCQAEGGTSPNGFSNRWYDVLLLLLVATSRATVGQTPNPSRELHGNFLYALFVPSKSPRQWDHPCTFLDIMVSAGASEGNMSLNEFVGGL
jgi:hypothetical protein